MWGQHPIIKQDHAELRIGPGVQVWEHVLDDPKPLGQLNPLGLLMLEATTLIHTHSHASHARAEVLHTCVEGVEVVLLPLRRTRLYGGQDASGDRYVRGTVGVKLIIGLSGDPCMVSLPRRHVGEDGPDEAKCMTMLGRGKLMP